MAVQHEIVHGIEQGLHRHVNARLWNGSCLGCIGHDGVILDCGVAVGLAHQLLGVVVTDAAGLIANVDLSFLSHNKKAFKELDFSLDMHLGDGVLDLHGGSEADRHALDEICTDLFGISSRLLR